MMWAREVHLRTGHAVTSAEIAIRAVTESDLAGLLAVYEEGRTAPPSEQERSTLQEMLGARGLHLSCAVDGGELVGTATMQVMPNLVYRCRPTAFIEAVNVRSHWRRRGIATAMMQHLVSIASSAGCNKVQLLSHKRHSADGAHALYEGLDFEAEAEGFRRYLGEPPAAVVRHRVGRS